MKKWDEIFEQIFDTIFYRNCARKPIPSLPASAVG